MMRFDDALPTFVALIRKQLGRELLAKSLILRDANGRLTLILRDTLDAGARQVFDREAEKQLGSYVSGPSATPQELFDVTLASDADAVIEHVSADGDLITVKIVDRRIVGQDWN